MLPWTVCILTIISGEHVKKSLIRPLSENLVISESMVQKNLGLWLLWTLPFNIYSISLISSIQLVEKYISLTILCDLNVTLTRKSYALTYTKDIQGSYNKRDVPKIPCAIISLQCNNLEVSEDHWANLINCRLADFRWQREGNFVQWAAFLTK